MTWRSVILGLLAAAVLCGVTFFNDMVMRGTFLVGNYLPLSVFGSLVLFILLVNPLLRLVHRSAPLSSRELAVVVTLALFACYVPGRGLMHFFSTLAMLPHHHARTRTEWQAGPTRLDAGAVLDWPAVLRALAADGGGTGGAAEPLRRRVLAALPAPIREGLAAAAGAAPPPVEVRDAVVRAVNEALADRSLVGAARARAAVLPNYLQGRLERDPETFSDADVETVNRAQLGAWLGPALKPFKPAVVDCAPPAMLADISRDPSRALDGFVTGLAEGDTSLRVRDVPWFAWRRTLWFWVPLILTMCMTVTGLALVIHRQWSSHELLPYPTVEFARALLPAEGSTLSPVLRNRLFWVAAAAVTVIHMTNYAAVWWPDYVVPVKLRFEFGSILNISMLRVFWRGPWWIIFNPTVYFTAAGFAYFLAADVSLSLGLAPYIYCLVVGWCAGYGITFQDSFLEPGLNTSLYAGAYCGLFVVLAYTGRRYYRTVFCRSLQLPARDTAEPHAVWGARVFLAGAVLFVLQLMRVGVDWQLALFYTCGTLVIFVVISRLLAEAGVFFVHSYWFPCALLTGLIGTRAMNPDQLLPLSIVSAILLIDPREALLPYAASGFRLIDGTGGRLGRVAAWGLLAVVIGLIVAIPVTLYLQYRHGAIQAGDGWTCHSVPVFPFAVSSKARLNLEAQGLLEGALSVRGWGHFRNMLPAEPVLVGFAVTFGLVLLFTFCRHRFAGWPLHPLMFLILGTWQSQNLAFSFLLGFMVKTGVTRFGGATAYHRFKPFMIGLIAGEMVCGIIPVVVGSIYYFIQGKPPMRFMVMPT